MKKFQNIFMKDSSNRKLHPLFIIYDIYQCFFYKDFMKNIWSTIFFYLFISLEIINGLTFVKYITYLHYILKIEKSSKKNETIICFDPTFLKFNCHYLSLSILEVFIFTKKKNFGWLDLFFSAFSSSSFAWTKKSLLKKFNWIEFFLLKKNLDTRCRSVKKSFRGPTPFHSFIHSFIQRFYSFKNSLSKAMLSLIGQTTLVANRNMDILKEAKEKRLETSQWGDETKKNGTGVGYVDHTKIIK